MHRAFLNIGYTLDEKQLRAHFAKFGVVSDTYVPKHSSGRNKGFGFATFVSAEALERALLTPVHVIDGVVVQVKRAGPRPPDAETHTLPPPASSSSQPRQPQQPFGKGPRLYVGGVADALSEERLHRHFARWGNVADVYFPGKRGHKRVNYCFVTFDDWKSAQRACDQSERSVDGWPLESISLAGARKQEMHVQSGPDSSPFAFSAKSYDDMAAAPMVPLGHLPGYATWLQQQLDQLQAKLSTQALSAALMSQGAQGSPVGYQPAQGQATTADFAQQQYLQKLQLEMQAKSMPSAAMQAAESWTRYACSEGGSHIYNPAGMQPQHSNPDFGTHLQPPAGCAPPTNPFLSFAHSHSGSASRMPGLQQQLGVHFGQQNLVPAFTPLPDQQQLNTSWHAQLAPPGGTYNLHPQQGAPQPTDPHQSHPFYFS